MHLIKKLFIAFAALLLLAVGWFYLTRTPWPNELAREAVGEVNNNPNGYILNSYQSGEGASVILAASVGREASDFNELTSIINNSGYQTHATDFLSPVDLIFFKSIDDYVKAFDPFLKTHRSQEPTVLIGHAFGNRIVRMAAYENPENVKAVILLAAGGQAPMEPKARQALFDIFDPMKSHKARMEDVRYAFFAEGNEIPDHWTRGWHTKTAMAQAEAVAASADDDSWHCAGGVPMLIVQPMQDRIAPIENAYALRDKCPQEVEIVEVQNAGHALLPEQPEAVAEAVLAFLAKHHPIETE